MTNKDMMTLTMMNDNVDLMMKRIDAIMAAASPKPILSSSTSPTTTQGGSTDDAAKPTKIIGPNKR